MQGQEDTSAFVKQVAKLALRHTTPSASSTQDTLLPKEMRVLKAQTGDKRLPTMPEAAAMVMLEFAHIDAVRSKVNTKHNAEALSRKMHQEGIWLDGHLNSIMTAFAVSGVLESMGDTVMTRTRESMSAKQVGSLKDIFKNCEKKTGMPIPKPPALVLASADHTARATSDYIAEAKLNADKEWMQMMRAVNTDVVATPVSDDMWNEITAGASSDLPSPSKHRKTIDLVPGGQGFGPDGNLRRRVREESPHDADADTDADPKP